MNLGFVTKELTAFHLCHHRSSIFYETLSKDGGVLTVHEYSLLAKESVKAGCSCFLQGSCRVTLFTMF